MSQYQLFPDLKSDEYEELKADIAERGVMVPVEYDDAGNVLDGHHREKICRELGIKDYPSIIRYGLSEAEKRVHVRKLNLARRHLTKEQWVTVRREMREEGYTYQQIADETNCSTKTAYNQTSDVELCKNTKLEGKDGKARPPKYERKPTVFATTGKERETALVPEVAEKLATGSTSSVVEAKRAVKEDERQSRRNENAKLIAAADTGLPVGAKFSTIVADPPWDWGDEGDVDQMGRAKPTYGTMAIDELLDFRPCGDDRTVADIADDNCHLYLWVTNRSLPKGFRLLEEWGFRYITCLTWCKPSFGMGNYFRGSTEQILFGVRGSQPLRRKDKPTHYLWDRGDGGHSSKPQESYSLIEECSPGPFLELFSRRKRDGWTCLGAEA